MREVAETPLTILVWGPGPQGGDLYNKRLQIRGQLRSIGIAALFSEEINVVGNYPELSAKANEMCQALAADFIIVIQSSPGSTAEVHDFAGFIEDIGRKMLIFIDERAQDGYSFTGALRELKVRYNCVETFSYPKDIEECNLMQAVQDKVRMLQLTKWRNQFQ